MSASLIVCARFYWRVSKYIPKTCRRRGTISFLCRQISYEGWNKDGDGFRLSAVPTVADMWSTNVKQSNESAKVTECVIIQRIHPSLLKWAHRLPFVTSRWRRWPGPLWSCVTYEIGRKEVTHTGKKKKNTKPRSTLLELVLAFSVRFAGFWKGIALEYCIYVMNTKKTPLSDQNYYRWLKTNLKNWS